MARHIHVHIHGSVADAFNEADHSREHGKFTSGANHTGPTKFVSSTPFVGSQRHHQVMTERHSNAAARSESPEEKTFHEQGAKLHDYAQFSGRKEQSAANKHTKSGAGKFYAK